LLSHSRTGILGCVCVCVCVCARACVCVCVCLCLCDQLQTLVQFLGGRTAGCHLYCLPKQSLYGPEHLNVLRIGILRCCISNKWYISWEERGNAYFGQDHWLNYHDFERRELLKLFNICKLSDIVTITMKISELYNTARCVRNHNNNNTNNNVKTTIIIIIIIIINFFIYWINSLLTNYKIITDDDDDDDDNNNNFIGLSLSDWSYKIDWHVL
jgi:hypothetical protein